MIALETAKVDVLIDAAAIAARVEQLAKDIQQDIGDEPILLVAVLKGSFVFLADLCRHFGSNVSLDFLQVSSYGDGTVSSGIVQILKDIDQSLEGKNVVIVEDIVDTGATLAHLRELLLLRQPKSLRIVALLNKPETRKVNIKIDYVGFEIPNKFVVGYGLDIAEKYRNLPFVGVLHPEDLS